MQMSARDDRHREELVGQLINELARVIQDGESAYMIARQAGFPPSSLPSFTMPQVFWHTVARQAELGVLRGGVEPILKQALTMYPENSTFLRVGRAIDPDLLPQHSSEWTSEAAVEDDFAPSESAEHPELAPDKNDANTRGTTRLGTSVELQREASRKHLDLEVHKIASAIADVLAQADGELCFALYGPWGRGKTTLARLACDALVGRAKTPRYQEVWFNAWKYRSPPEIWAHLYESLAHAATSGGPLARPAHAIRANVSKLGLWPLTTAFTLLSVALIPFSYKAKGTLWVWMQVTGVLGVLGAIWLIFAFQKTASVADRVWKLYGALPSHRDKLGLQATIGQDLRHLLRGWIWSPFSHHPTDAIDRRARGNLREGPGRASLVLFAASTCLVGLMINHVLLTLSQATVPYSTFPILWGAASLLVSWTIVRGGRQNERVILVVDDLDRCSPDLMLEILESIKLLVEEPEICDRLQVMVLVDDEMLFRAVADRFESYVQKTPKDRKEALRRRLVREHLDKIFLADFRLGKLSEHDVVALVKKFTDYIGEPIVEEDERGDATRTSTSDAPSSIRDLGISQQSGSAEKEADDDDVATSAFEKAECEALIKECAQLLVGPSAPRVGPRLIRSMVLRYQLARRLLAKLEIPIDPSAIARGIVLATRGNRAVRLKMGESSARQARVVIDQVAGINSYGIDR